MPPEEIQTETASPAATRAVASATLYAPLRRRVFRMLWLVWLSANVCMWMNDVAAAWLMTSLTSSPVLVALVQTAATSPMFLFGLPSGALADVLDRRRYFLTTQIWVAVVALVLCVAVFSGLLTPYFLLGLVFANGIGLAMRWPVFSALVPELVEREELSSALALNAVATNASRIIGPLLAGFLIAWSGSSTVVFALNAVLSVASSLAILRWRRVQAPDPLGREPLGQAMRVGVQFVLQSPGLRAVLWRQASFFLHVTTLLALLPLVARDLPDGDAGTFTVLLACMGAGAITGAWFLPRLRQKVARDTLVRWGTMVACAALATVALSRNVYVVAGAMVVGGMAWIGTTNTLVVSAQYMLPDWVRARGMAICQMVMMGASASGAALWGKVAGLINVHISMVLAAVCGAAVMLLVMRLAPDQALLEDLSRSPALPPPEPSPGGHGNVVVQVEYHIDPKRARAFVALMQESRRSRLRQGALSWELVRDLGDETHYVERIVDASWTEHLRRLSRATAADVALRERKLAFLANKSAPRVTRWIVQERLH